MTAELTVEIQYLRSTRNSALPPTPPPRATAPTFLRPQGLYPFCRQTVGAKRWTRAHSDASERRKQMVAVERTFRPVGAAAVGHPADGVAPRQMAFEKEWFKNTIADLK